MAAPARFLLASALLVATPITPWFVDATPSAVQAENDDTLTIQATGEVEVAATRVGLQTFLVSKADTAGAALTLHQTARLRALEGMGSLGVELPLVETGGLRVQRQQASGQDVGNGLVVINGRVQQQGNDEEGFEVRERLTFWAKLPEDGLEAATSLASLMDTAQELGLLFDEVASNPWVTSYPQDANQGVGPLKHWLSPDAAAAAQRSADVQALTAARTRAATLALDAGRALGKVVSMDANASAPTWSGVGRPVRVTSQLSVTFRLER
jgi:uncharacterized protein YggE